MKTEIRSIQSLEIADLSPDSKQDLTKVMEDVQKYYLRNSDQIFISILLSVPLLLDYLNGEKVPKGTGVDNDFDSTGETYWSKAINYADGKKMTFWGQGPLYKPGR